MDTDIIWSQLKLQYMVSLSNVVIYSDPLFDDIVKV